MSVSSNPERTTLKAVRVLISASLAFLMLGCGLKIIKDAVMEKDAWPVAGGSNGKLHYSELEQINRNTVSDLSLAWALPIDSPNGLVSEPIVVDGVAYISAPLSVVYAVDIRTADILWSFTPTIDLAVNLGTSWGARTNRGVAVSEGLVYVGTGDCRVIAIDAGSGKSVWETPVCDPREGFGAGITGAPSVGNGKVYMGYLGSETGARGALVALDAKHGTELWRFWTVPGKEDVAENDALARAAKTWANGSPQRGGGAVWDAITFDAVTNMVYFGTASRVPYLDTNREPSGTDNLYTNSIVAVDADTGEYAWHYQTVPQDVWDYDAAMHIMAADIEIDGKKRRVVMQAPKNGFFYVLDAENGELLSADAIVPVNWASHVDLATGRPVFKPEAKYYNFPEQKTKVYPGVNGAHNWHAMSLNPDLGLVYIPANELGGYYGVFEDGTAWYDNSSFDADGNITENAGRLIAWDPVKKAPRWKAVLQKPFNGGTLTTAGGLVFMGESTGKLVAYDGVSGERLWQFHAGSSINANPVTFTLDGHQYVMVNAGQGSGITISSAEMTMTDESKGGRSMLMAFKLHGDGQLPQPHAFDPIPMPYRLPSDKSRVEEGKLLWKMAGCSSCHGTNLVSIERRALNGAVPDLRYSPEIVHEQWLGIVFGARMDKGMPAFNGMISIEQARSIQEYVLHRAWEKFCQEQQKLTSNVRVGCEQKVESGRAN